MAEKVLTLLEYLRNFKDKENTPIGADVVRRMVDGLEASVTTRLCGTSTNVLKDPNYTIPTAMDPR